MKSIIAILLFLSLSAFAQQLQTPYRIELKDVVQKVSHENLEVYQNALKVYQAKKHISYSRANLLPKLNIWRILSIPFDPKGLLSIIGDIAPFLIPSNWFQVKIDKQLYAAQEQAYRALWANEVMTAKALYFQLVFDHQLLLKIQQNKAELQKLKSIAKSREVLGGAPVGASREIEIRLLALEEDIRSLKILIEEEMSLLAYMLGFNSTVELELAPVPFMNMDSADSFTYDTYERQVIEVSPELKQLDHIIEASKYIKKKIQFSLFGVTNESKGVAGGIFDNIPLQDGLGFGAPYSMQISKSETAILKLQRQGAEETLKRQLRLVVANQNLDHENFSGVLRRASLTQEASKQLFTRIELGESVTLFDLVEASRNQVQADMALFSAQIRILINQDKLERLTMTGDYLLGPPARDGMTRQETP